MVRLAFLIRGLLATTALAASAAFAAPAQAGTASLNLVLVMDGMRPDSITAEDTPNLYRLRQEGVNFVNGHSVFPTVTRVNATAIGTGVYPSKNGIFGNSLYVRAFDPNHSFGNDDHRNLLKLDQVTNGGMILSKTLGEILKEHGKTLAVVSSADSAGSALLANARAPKGVGVLVNGYWERGVRAAFPDSVNTAILSRFEPAPLPGGGRDSLAPQVNWTQGVLRNYVLSEVKPDVIINWFTEPDHTQHAMGAGSPEARAVIRNDDREVGLLIERLRALGLEGKTNIIVVSDHGFGANDFGIDLQGELIKAKLKAGADSDDVVLAPSGQAVALHVRNHDAARITALVQFLQKQPWTGAIFTAGKAGGGAVPVEGREPGTFSLELIHLAHEARGPDIVLTF